MMRRSLVDRIYELASRYTVTVEVMYSTTRIQVVDLNNSRLRKASVFTFSDVPVGTDMEDYCLQKLEELVKSIELSK